MQFRYHKYRFVSCIENELVFLHHKTELLNPKPDPIDFAIENITSKNHQNPNQKFQNTQQTTKSNPHYTRIRNVETSHRRIVNISTRPTWSVANESPLFMRLSVKSYAHLNAGFITCFIHGLAITVKCTYSIGLRGVANFQCRQTRKVGANIGIRSPEVPSRGLWLGSKRGRSTN